MKSRFSQILKRNDGAQISFSPLTLQGVHLFGKGTMQADSCLHSEQINTLVISVGGQDSVFGGGSFWDGIMRTL